MIRLITVGKSKEYPQFEEYLSRCKDVEHIAVKEEKDKNFELVKQKECARLSEKSKGYKVVLTEEGILLTSKMLAELIKKNNQISFLVGGAYGISFELKEEADMLFSLSRLTFPHELAHVILVEQIYRAQKINEGHPYHK